MLLLIVSIHHLALNIYNILLVLILLHPAHFGALKSILFRSLLKNKYQNLIFNSFKEFFSWLFKFFVIITANNWSVNINAWPHKKVKLIKPFMCEVWNSEVKISVYCLSNISTSKPRAFKKRVNKILPCERFIVFIFFIRSNLFMKTLYQWGDMIISFFFCKHARALFSNIEENGLRY